MRLKKHPFQFLALFGRWINWVHWLVLAGSLGFTYQIHEWQKSQIRNEWRLKFDAEVREVPHLIEARLEYNLQMLKGVAGLLGASANVDRRGFRNYTEAVLGQNTGVLGLSFSPIVPNVGKDQYETAVRRSGLLDFRIHPQGTREFYTPVQYLEPQSGANLRALGYDIYSDSVRRTAMVSARDSGAGTITSKILLVQDGKESPQAGALLLYPVYDKGMPIDTLDARRSSIVGWVAAPFHMHVLLGNLLGASGTEIDIEIYDGENIAGDKLIYDDDPEYDLQVANEVVGFQSTQRIVVGGRTWMVQTGAKPGFLEQQGGYGHLNTFFIAGAIASLLLTLLVYILAIARRRAIAKTQELSVDLDNSLLADKAKSEFLANMSHEIRTPMNSILGLSQLCLQTGLDQRQHDYISKVNLSAQGLLGVINDILDFSKIDAGMLALELVHFDLSSSLQLLDSSVGHLARAKGLRFNMNVESDVPAYLVGDPLRLGQVLLNLASNAVKFTVEGEVGVSIKLKEQDGDSVVVEFEVSDTGIGLTSEQSKGMFLAFTQVDTSTTRKFGGTGLGLAISKRLVDLMGGTISLTSDVGTGSNFFFTARFSRGEANKAISFMGSVEEPAALWRLKGRRILVAEDNEFNQDVIREILEQCGVVVVLCNNGSEVLQCLASESYDMVLMDIQMPVMDGYEATRRIRATPSLADQCVIAMTANVMALDQQRCVACGMNDFVSKPIDSNFLYKTLLKWLPGEDQLPDVAEVEPIDLSVLGRLLNGDSVKTCKFAKKFLQSSRTAVVEMLAAQASGDLEMLSRLGHKHKSAAGSVGAAGLVELCSALEASSKAGDRAHVEKLLAQMPAQVDEIAKQLARQKDWN
jgi:signal transduction histidine kinase/CheY-like chemotaxis protein/HPt (histidine-containing phosphotransfer) domain-containing protein